MLAEFQQAIADLTASPKLCISARQRPEILRERYALTDREWQRLVSVVQHRGMECACIVYRANRLAPLALNIPLTCKVLGPALREIASEFWEMYPEANVHFYVETDRFCRFLKQKVEAGEVNAEQVGPVLDWESARVAAALEESRTELNRSI